MDIGRCLPQELYEFASQLDGLTASLFYSYFFQKGDAGTYS